MDHLPLPSPPHDAHVDVIVRRDEYIDLAYSPPWDTFPERNGYFRGELESLAGAKLDPGSLARLATFCQRWLFFGLIAEFLGVEFEEEEWTRTRKQDGVQVVSTSRLLPLLERWRLDMLKLSTSDRLRKREHLTRLLHDVDLHLVTLTFSYDFESKSGLLPLDLSLSLFALHATLAAAMHSVFEQGTVHVSSQGAFPNLTQHFLSNGWCRSDVHRVRQDGGILTEYYASRLGKLPVWHDHSGCSIELCFAGQVDSSTYETKHVTDGCGCEFAGIPSEQVADAIDRGDTPLVTIESSSDGTVASLITTSSSPRGYTAISHVWAEGLGNPFRNQLPSCQLKRIQARVNALYGSGSNEPFWIDTLCIPVGRDYKPQKMKAISTMVDIYQESENVLILSKELANIHTERTMLELVARTTRTLWFRRLWTLQEGILPRRVLFQFQDAFISMQALIDSSDDYGDSVEDSLRHLLHQEFLSSITKMEAFKQTPAEERIRHIWSAVQWRTTSNAEDETICLAAMLNVDSRPLLRVPRDAPDAAVQRMQAFILHQKYFPTASMFQPSQEDRMQEEGFRWAPASFVFRATKPGSDISTSPLALADARGLHVSLPGLKMQKQDLERMPCVFNFLVPQDWDHYYRATALVEDDEVPWIKSPELLNAGRPMIVLASDTILTAKSSTGAMFTHDMIEDGKSPVEHTRVDCRGVLAIVTDDVDGELQAALTVPLAITKEAWNSSRCPAYEQYWSMLDGAGSKPDDFVYLDTLPASQKWCIG